MDERRFPGRVEIVEVGPRDGLQNEQRAIPAATKVRFIERLADAGLRVIEATSFVDPRWVPQLADAEEVFAALHRTPGVRYSVLVPNERGLERALAAGVTEIAIFGSATETFSRKNLNRSVEDATEMFRPVVRRAKDAGLRVRADLSMAFGDPWEGAVPVAQAVEAGRRLLDLGADELCVADTIGVGTAADVVAVVRGCVAAGVPVARLGVHFHDTYGQGLANVLAALQEGVAIVDASAGGLGGCPYAKSATGNLATEDLVWMLRGLGLESGVDLHALARVSAWISSELGHEPPGRVARALAGAAPVQ